MYLVAVRRQFSAAHRLEAHPGKCSQLHGHTWMVEASFDGPRVGEDGMLLDFEELADALEEIVADLDHTCLNDLPPFYEIPPTAENVARLIHERLEELAEGRDAWENTRLASVTVWESPDARATYGEGPNPGVEAPRESGHA